MRLFVGRVLVTAVLIAPAASLVQAAPAGGAQEKNQFQAKPRRHHHHQGHRKARAALTAPALHQPMTGLSAAGATTTSQSAPASEEAAGGDVAIALAIAAGVGLLGGARLRSIARA